MPVNVIMELDTFSLSI